MISINAIKIEFPIEGVSEGMGIIPVMGDGQMYICPMRIDCVSAIRGDRKIKAVIRYMDDVLGLRLIHVSQTAHDIAAARRKELAGGNSDEIDTEYDGM